MTPAPSRLQVHNNWMTLSYSLGGAPFPVNEGGSIRVHWPDGTTTTERYTVQSRTVEYSDHGHRYTAEQRTPMLVLTHRGQIVLHPMTDMVLSREDTP